MTPAPFVVAVVVAVVAVVAAPFSRFHKAIVVLVLFQFRCLLPPGGDGWHRPNVFHCFVCYSMNSILIKLSELQLTLIGLTAAVSIAD